MAKPRKPLACPRRSRTYSVVQVGPNRFDAFAARTVGQAKQLATAADADDSMVLFSVCASDASEAKTLHSAGKSFLVKRIQRAKRVKTK